MEKTLVITDVTRMKAPRVCIAGIAEDGESIRPILPNPGILEQWLYHGNKAVIRPFARVTFFLLKKQNQAPHTEDWEVSPNFSADSNVLTAEERKELLKTMAKRSMDDLFGATIHQAGTGFFIQQGEGLRSLGTISPKRVNFVAICEEYFKISYRLGFSDWNSKEYSLPITDLSFQYYLRYLQNVEGRDCLQIRQNLENSLKKTELYLRIGLARGFNPDPQKAQDRCYLQITGIYNFPDYLHQRCFADYA